MDNQQTYVFVHAHPDDETLWTGALIATAAASGDRVIVVTCTRGERGEVIQAPGTPTEFRDDLAGNFATLGRYRSGELRNALAALGSNIEHYFLDELPLPDGRAGSGLYQDSGMVWLVEPRVGGHNTSTGGVAGPDPEAWEGFANNRSSEPMARLGYLLLQLRSRFRLVTYEADGGYGHPDHVRAHEISVQALDWVSRSARLPGTNPIAAQLWEVTKPGEPFDVQIPVFPVLPQLLNAMRCYATQVQNVRENVDTEAGRVGWFGLSNGVPLPIRDTEKYRITSY